MAPGAMVGRLPAYGPRRRIRNQHRDAAEGAGAAPRSGSSKRAAGPRHTRALALLAETLAKRLPTAAGPDPAILQSFDPASAAAPARAIYIGTAGWGVAHRYAASFGGTGSHLERYARVLSASEINSSAYRAHRFETYVRWRQSVPADFRFSIKLPQTLTHNHALEADSAALDRFARESSGLGPKLAILLVQFPPRLAFDGAAARRFFSKTKGSVPARLACEPRHATWASEEADALMKELSIARVAADPPRWERDELPGGDRTVSYFRLHGSPRTYFSAYGNDQLERFAARLTTAAAVSACVWCIFDNTAHGHATANALDLERRFGRSYSGINGRSDIRSEAERR